MGGVSAAISKTAAAPIERVKLLIQNQVSIKSFRSRALPWKYPHQFTLLFSLLPFGVLRTSLPVTLGTDIFSHGVNFVIGSNPKLSRSHI